MATTHGILQLAVTALLVAPTTDAQLYMRYSIILQQPAQLVIPDELALKTPCRTRKKVAGCTVFAEQALACSCEQHGERWQLQAAANLAPMMFICKGRSDVVEHEELHIDDFRTLLGEYLDGLTSRDFVSEEQCLRMAKVASDPAHFVRVMNDIRSKSAAWRDR